LSGLVLNALSSFYQKQRDEVKDTGRGWPVRLREKTHRWQTAAKSEPALLVMIRGVSNRAGYSLR
jgi:hypothetical protein